MLIAKNIPPSMKAKRQWVCWKTITRDRPTKVPFQETGLPASSTNPTTWTSFEEAFAASSKFDGIGFVFGPEREMFGIDLDGCRDPETGRVAEWAREVIVFLNSYAEVSPSRTGVKIFCLGRLPFETGKKVSVAAERITPDKEPAIEAYDHARYFAVTGATLAGMPDEPQDRTEQVKHICSVYFKEKPLDRPRGPQDRTSRLSVIERARKYLERLPASVSGQGGHNAAFHAACVLVMGFGLNRTEAMILMSEFNQRCQPPWSERELEHKVDSAEKQPGDRGFLRDTKPEHWDTTPLPKYQDPETPVAPTEIKITTLESAAAKYLASLESGTNDLVSLGIGDLDHALAGGCSFGEMVIVAARPSHGKTAFAMQCLDAFATNGLPSAMISEEMSELALGKRTVQYAVETPEEHWLTRVEKVRSDLTVHFRDRQPCYVVEACRTAEAAGEAIKRLAGEKGVRCVAVDYAQLLTAKGKSRYEQITNTSIALRQAANATNVLLIVLCQLNREIESREKFVPKLCDLKDSGQLEQDADVVSFLVWPHKINPQNDPKEFQIWIAKNRNRAINNHFVECEFRPSRLRIVESRKPIEEHRNYHAEFSDYNESTTREF